MKQLDRRKRTRYVFAAELKNDILNVRFFMGALLILTAALLSEQVHLEFLIDAGGSQEGPGWFLAYSFCSNGPHTLLFVPIAVSFAAGGEAEKELHKTIHFRKDGRIHLFRRSDALYCHAAYAGDQLYCFWRYSGVK